MIQDIKNKTRGVRKRRCPPRLERMLIGLLAVYAAMLCMLGGVDYLCPDTISVYGQGIVSADGGVIRGIDMPLPHQNPVFCESDRVTLTLGGVVPLKTVTVRAYEERSLIPGGMLFGVRCGLEGVLVVGLEDVVSGCCPAKDAGVRVGDVITAVDGATVSSAAALSAAISAAWNIIAEKLKAA